MITMRKRTATLFFWGLVLACGSVAAQQGPGLIAKNPIKLTNVEGRMDHLGVDVKGQRLFATAFDNRTLEVIDLKTGRQIRSITGLNEPQGAYYDPATNRLFVACGGDGTVKMFDDARSNHIIVGYGGEKFLAGKVTRPGGGGALAILDTNGKQVGNIDMDAHPESFELEKMGTRVFVNVPDRQEAEVADLVKGTVVARWPVTACT